MIGQAVVTGKKVATTIYALEYTLPIGACIKRGCRLRINGQCLKAGTGQTGVNRGPINPTVSTLKNATPIRACIKRARWVNRINCQGLNIEVITQPVVDVIPCIPSIRAFEHATTECSCI